MSCILDDSGAVNLKSMAQGEPGKPGAAFSPRKSNHSVQMQMKALRLMEKHKIEYKQGQTF